VDFLFKQISCFDFTNNTIVSGKIPVRCNPSDFSLSFSYRKKGKFSIADAMKRLLIQYSQLTQTIKEMIK